MNHQIVAHIAYSMTTPVRYLDHKPFEGSSSPCAGRCGGHDKEMLSQKFKLLQVGMSMFLEIKGLKWGPQTATGNPNSIVGI